MDLEYIHYRIIPLFMAMTDIITIYYVFCIVQLFQGKALYKYLLLYYYYLHYNTQAPNPLHHCHEKNTRFYSYEHIPKILPNDTNFMKMLLILIVCLCEGVRIFMEVLHSSTVEILISFF